MATDASGLSRDDAREARSMPPSLPPSLGSFADYERHAALLRFTTVSKVLRPKPDSCEGWMGTPESITLFVAGKWVEMEEPEVLSLYDIMQTGPEERDIHQTCI